MSTVVLINDIIPYLGIYVATPTGIGQSPGLLKGRLPIIYRSPVRSHIPIVLFQAVGKTVMPVVVAHKLEVVSVRGMLGCFGGALDMIGTRCRRGPDSSGHLEELLHDGGNHFWHALCASEFVGAGEEVAFKRFRLRRQIGDQSYISLRRPQKILTRSQSAILHGLGDIEDGIALGDHNRTNIDIPTNKATLHANNRRLFVEIIFSGFERALVMKVVPKHERIGTADYS